MPGFLTPDPESYADSSNLYAYAANDPVNSSDPSGRLVETVWDLASLGMGVYQISQWDEKTTFWEKAVDVIGVTADSVAVALSFIPGGAGAAVRAYRAGCRAHQAITTGRAIDRAVNSFQAVDQTVNIAQGAHNVADDVRNDRVGLGTAMNALQATIVIPCSSASFSWKCRTL